MWTLSEVRLLARFLTMVMSRPIWPVKEEQEQQTEKN